MSILIDCLNNPPILRTLEPAAWDHLLRQARRSMLMGLLADIVDGEGLMAMIPTIASNQLKSGRILCQKIGHDIRQELNHLDAALQDHPGPVILLKGAAYLLADLPAAQGRMFGDIDLLVDKRDLSTIETLLNDGGWSTAGTDPYDEAYYRRWTHELPPLEHIDRGSIIDLHHAIVQERRIPPFDRSGMITQAVPIHPRFSILQPVDMVLHACVHLFNDGEFDKGLRDLVDTACLIRHFAATEPNFYPNLVARAHELAFERQLYYGLRYSHRLLALNHPEGLQEALRPAGHQDWIMDGLFDRALAPMHSTADDGWTHKARQLLYLRGHYLRMPVRHLLTHLIRKSIQGDSPHPGMQTDRAAI